jgi:hypothetical protein
MLFALFFRFCKLLLMSNFAPSFLWDHLIMFIFCAGAATVFHPCVELWYAVWKAAQVWLPQLHFHLPSARYFLANSNFSWCSDTRLDLDSIRIRIILWIRISWVQYKLYWTSRTCVKYLWFVPVLESSFDVFPHLGHHIRIPYLWLDAGLRIRIPIRVKSWIRIRI